MSEEKHPWTIETMLIINKLTPEIKGKAFDPEWFLLRQRFEQMEDALNAKDGIHGASPDATSEQERR